VLYLSGWLQEKRLAALFNVSDFGEELRQTSSPGRGGGGDEVALTAFGEGGRIALRHRGQMTAVERKKSLADEVMCTNSLVLQSMT